MNVIYAFCNRQSHPDQTSHGAPSHPQGCLRLPGSRYFCLVDFVSCSSKILEVWVPPRSGSLAECPVKPGTPASIEQTYKPYTLVGPTVTRPVSDSSCVKPLQLTIYTTLTRQKWSHNTLLLSCTWRWGKIV